MIFYLAFWMSVMKTSLLLPRLPLALLILLCCKSTRRVKQECDVICINIQNVLNGVHVKPLNWNNTFCYCLHHENEFSWKCEHFCKLVWLSDISSGKFSGGFWFCLNWSVLPQRQISGVNVSCNYPVLTLALYQNEELGLYEKPDLLEP